jgi:hypothetical protein
MATEAPAAPEAEPENKGPAFTGGSAPLRPKSDAPGAFIGTSLGGGAHSKFLNALFYGRHGSGKSTLCGSAVDVDEMQDVLVVTAEGGSVVFENNPRIVNWEKIDVIKIDRIEQMQKVYEWLRAHVQYRDREGEPAEAQLRKLQDAAFSFPDHERLRRYRTVILDSLTEIEAQNLSKILDLDTLGIDAGDDMAVAGYPQFRKNMHIIMKLTRNFRDLDINFFAVCSETWVQDERKAFHYTPRLTGQLKEIIQGFFDVVGWLVPSSAVDAATGTAPRRLFVQPQTMPKADAKCRLATFQKPAFDDPVMRDIMSQTGFIQD